MIDVHYASLTSHGLTYVMCNGVEYVVWFFCLQELTLSLWCVHFSNKDSVERGTNANSHMILLWTGRERKEVFMWIPEMWMIVLKMVLQLILKLSFIVDSVQFIVGVCLFQHSANSLIHQINLNFCLKNVTKKPG